jgi:hypothetical protein
MRTSPKDVHVVLLVVDIMDVTTDSESIADLAVPLIAPMLKRS